MLFLFLVLKKVGCVPWCLHTRDHVTTGYKGHISCCFADLQVSLPVTVYRYLMVYFRYVFTLLRDTLPGLSWTFCQIRKVLHSGVVCQVYWECRCTCCANTVSLHLIMQCAHTASINKSNWYCTSTVSEWDSNILPIRYSYILAIWGVGGGGGGGVTEQSFIRGGSALRPKPLPFYISYTFHRKNVYLSYIYGATFC